MQLVSSENIRDWYAQAANLAEPLRSIGPAPHAVEYQQDVLGIPLHLAFVLDRLSRERGGHLAADVLDSIPFHSLCAGVLLPLSSMAPDKAAQLFGVAAGPPLSVAERERLATRFLQKEVGLSPIQKVCILLGDPFLGSPSTFRRDSLLGLLLSIELVGWRALLDRLTAAGDVAVLFAQSRPAQRVGPPLSAAEVLETLRLMSGVCAGARPEMVRPPLPPAGRGLKLALLRSLLFRSTRLEAYFLARLLLKHAGLSADPQTPLLAKALSTHFGAPLPQLLRAIAVSDPFHVTRVLSTQGPPGLRSIALQPLVAVRPALSGGSADSIRRYPVWVERKYDGIRLMLHKSTDSCGTSLAAAYTRGQKDWLDLIPGLDSVIRLLPARSFIIDGELYATRLEFAGVRPATVYEVYASLQGDRSIALSIRYAAFDLLYLNGADITSLPLAQRRSHLAHLLAPLSVAALPIPITLSEGQLAAGKDDVNRLYHHFRAQGHEGILAKDPDGPYRLGERDPSWLKRKPEITLDLVLLGAVLAVTAKRSAGVFGSYVLGARTEHGGFVDVGDVAGVDRMRDAEIQAEIAREGLTGGRRIERKGPAGVRPGIELAPAIVVAVKFEGIVRDTATGRLTLRAPRIIALRPDKRPSEADSMHAIEQIELRQKVG